MELPETLEVLQQHLAALVSVLQQEQDVLLNPQEDVDAVTRLRIEQDKQHAFAAIEALQGRFGDLKEALAGETADAAVSPQLRRAVSELTEQAVRLYQLNTTLIRQGLVHKQVVLLNLKQISSATSASMAPESDSSVTATVVVDTSKSEVPKPRSKRKSKVVAGSPTI